ncbi:MAG: lipopolysaccharide heptosyltransferase II [Deltaproteobacteria bacterium]|nr:lipopolysaccharide heptosyltransferase II [Deltaproteobacteria bacterium]
MSVKILLVQTAFIGDCILATPLVSALKAIYSDSSLSILTTPVAKEFFVSNPQVEEVLTYDKRGSQSGIRGLLSVARILQDKKFDLVFSLHKSWRTAVLLYLARIPLRYGFKEAAASFLYSKTASRKGISHEVLRNMALLKTIGRKAEEFSCGLSLTIPPAELFKAKQILGPESQTKYIAIAPGSVWATKRWTVAGFSALAKGLIERGMKIVLIGGSADAQTAGEIVRRVGSDSIINTVGQISLLTSAAVISHCRALITNDSAPLHIAAATKTPIVAIFCATVPEFGYGPWQVEHEMVQVDGLSCRPCGRHGHKDCPTGTHYCQINISERLVLDKLESLFAKEKE